MAKYTQNYVKIAVMAIILVNTVNLPYMHTIGQNKRLSLAREEGDRISEVPDPDPDPACSGTN